MQASNAGPISDALSAVPDPDLEARFADLADLDLDSSESPPASAFKWRAVGDSDRQASHASRSGFSLPLFVGDELEAPVPEPAPDDERPDENNPQRVPRFG